MCFVKRSHCFEYKIQNLKLRVIFSPFSTQRLYVLWKFKHYCQIFDFKIILAEYRFLEILKQIANWSAFIH